ncbi:MAG: PEP-CTERM sorting domain-containing protein [Patescibacteria group bacterium]|nr:PEP-CTERM sorting domain-containing protein [Patescibacteria group bacterium]MDE2015512.1 PEP-CTERM sorting domain-containing protein [Patescibacteria group bacterium]MDE2226872.1 PEP-CTERM sorting domain-containing protein [Patescibacteria group bacterium]
MKKKHRSTAAFALTMFAVLLFAAIQARADSITFDLTATNVPGYGTGPYVGVTISVPSGGGDATITFTSLTSDGYIYLLGSAQAVDFNTSLPVTISNITYTGGGSHTAFSLGGSGTVDGFGVFNNTVDAFDGFTNSVTSWSALLTPTSGSFADAASVLALNDKGWDASAHVNIGNPDCQGACTTGDVAGTYSPPTSTPEPTSIMLFGTGIIPVIGFARRKLKPSRKN